MWLTLIYKAWTYFSTWNRETNLETFKKKERIFEPTDFEQMKHFTVFTV